MTKTEAVRRAGNATKLAKLLSVTPQAVSRWPDILPQARGWQLRLLKPSWFRVRKPIAVG